MRSGYRLADMCLNRAEAYAKLGQYEKVITDVNRIRRRADLSGDALYPAGDLKGNDAVLDVVLLGSLDSKGKNF